MFRGFANVWTPVAPASALEEKPLGVRVAETPIVLFRDSRGAPAALVDQCPHRGVALSLGCVRGDAIECPFHGWQFERTGRVRLVPWNPDAKTERLGARALPVREAGGQLWVFTGSNAPGEPDVDPVFIDPSLRISGFVVDVGTHWTRVMENMLDWPHLPFVHAATIGRTMPRGGRERMDIAVEERPYGFHSTIAIDGAPQEGALDYRFPNVMVLTIPVPKKTLRMHIACVPVTPTSTRVVMMTARSFAKLAFFDRFFDRQNRKIAGEDLPVVESSDPPEVPEARDERSVRTDEPTLFFRKRYISELRDSDTQLIARPARLAS